MAENHEGKLLEAFIKLNKINVKEKLLPKLSFSNGTLYALYKAEHIDKKYKDELLKAGIDFLGQSPTTRLKQGLTFPQKETGLTERIDILEEQVRQLQTSLLDLYSRLPKQS